MQFQRALRERKGRLPCQVEFLFSPGSGYRISRCRGTADHDDLDTVEPFVIERLPQNSDGEPFLLEPSGVALDDVDKVVMRSVDEDRGRLKRGVG